MLHSRRAVLGAGAFLLLPSRLCARSEPRVFVVDDAGNPVMGAEFDIYPREYKWRRRDIEVITSAPAERDAEITAGVAAVDRDADKIILPFRAGVRQPCNKADWREGKIIICENLGTPPNASAQFWVRDRDPDTIIAGKIWMGVLPDRENDAKYQQILSHEVLHTLGAAHKSKVFPDGHQWGGWPVSVMHPYFFTYQAENENTNVLMDSDRHGLIKLNYRYENSGIAVSRRQRHRRKRRRK